MIKTGELDYRQLDGQAPTFWAQSSKALVVALCVP
jgi:hypothetical protein